MDLDNRYVINVLFDIYLYLPDLPIPIEFFSYIHPWLSFIGLVFFSPRML